jgi:hypothetical protein
MTTVSLADRVLAWNIRLLQCPSNECIAGTFQPLPPYEPFLTWGDLFDDLLLCFDLEFVQAPRGGALALWFRDGASDPAILLQDGRPAPCIYLDHSTLPSNHPGNVLAQHINVGVGSNRERYQEGIEGSDSPLLNLTLVIHDPGSCSLTNDNDLTSHLSNRMSPVPRYP